MPNVPSIKLPTLIFSLGLCWLLSLFTEGYVKAGTFNVVTNGEIGIEPPDVLFLIGSSLNAFFNALDAQFPIGELISVLYAR